MTPAEQPRVLGRYILEEPIATGTTATVWRARDTGRRRKFAVKVFHPHLVADETSRRRMLAEARLARRVKHPNIVSASDVIARNSEFALVFPFVDGEPLAERLRRE